MLKKIRAEFRRIFHYKADAIFIGVTIVLTLLIHALKFLDIFYLTPEKAQDFYQHVYSFPNNVIVTINSSYLIAFLLVPAITSYCVGSDYQFDTWKMILPRSSSRGKLFLAKIANLLLYLLFLLAVISLLILILSIIGAIYLKVSLVQFSAFDLSFDNQQQLLEIIVFTLWFSSLSTMITVITRSLIIGTFAPFAIFFCSNIIQKYSSEQISFWLASPHFSNLLPQVETIVKVHDSRPDCSPLVSWIMVISHILGAFLISYIVLKRQNFS